MTYFFRWKFASYGTQITKIISLFNLVDQCLDFGKSPHPAVLVDKDGYGSHDSHASAQQ